MATEVEMILQWFPLLKNDRDFKVTSPDTIEYNCISWALGLNDIWTWPDKPEARDEDMTWDNDLGHTESIESFISYFKCRGYETCNPAECTKDYTLVALYSHNGKGTHASRKLPDGIWTSKLGPWHDIQHSTPQMLEGKLYGKVYCYMRKRNSN